MGPFGGKSHTSLTTADLLFDHLALHGQILLDFSTQKIKLICSLFLNVSFTYFGIILDDLLIPVPFSHATVFTLSFNVFPHQQIMIFDIPHPLFRYQFLN